MRASKAAITGWTSPVGQPVLQGFSPPQFEVRHRDAGILPVTGAQAAARIEFSSRVA